MADIGARVVLGLLVPSLRINHSGDYWPLARAARCLSMPAMSRATSLDPVTSNDLPAPVGPYSPGMRAGNLIFVSGQAGRDPNTGLLPSGIEAQTEQALRNVSAILTAAGSSLTHVIRCGVFLIDMAEFPRMNAVYSRMFGDHRPARTTVQVSGLPGEGLVVEIDAVAVVAGGSTD